MLVRVGENVPNFFLDSDNCVAGLDEAGRGPLAGPVVAACVLLDNLNPISGLNDSKKLSAKKRETLFDEIEKKARSIGVAIISPARIDEINILRASLEAMRIAYFEAQKKIKEKILALLIDGNQLLEEIQGIRQAAIIKGDGRCEAIMAASIVAKVLRDRIMTKAALHYSSYGFERHMGYGTREHVEALMKFGPTPLHRRSFAPVQKACALHFGG